MGYTTSIIWHDFNDHNHLIQYNYKSNCKHSLFFFQNPISEFSYSNKKFKTQISLFKFQNNFFELK